MAVAEGGCLAAASSITSGPSEPEKSARENSSSVTMLDELPPPPPGCGEPPAPVPERIFSGEELREELGVRWGERALASSPS